MAKSKMFSCRIDQDLHESVQASNLDIRKFIEAMFRHKLQAPTCPTCGQMTPKKRKKK